MAKISNKFIVTALLDGQTVSGELVSTRSLWQAIDHSGNVIPDWTSAAENNKPRLYPLLQSGGEILQPKTITWRYNNEVIEFDATTHLSTNSAFPGVFKEADYTPSGGKLVPSLLIMKNLASGSNEDNDTISMSGSVLVNDSELHFEAMQMVHITKASATANICELILVGGKNTLQSDTDTVQIQAVYHTNESSVSTSNYTVKWYWNGSQQRTTTGGTDNHTITITGAEVVDYVVVEARVFVEGTQKAIAFVGIDDIGDTDQMQFAYTIYDVNSTPPTNIIQNNTTAATLKSGQAVRYAMWIGTAENPFEQRSTSWVHTAQIYASDGTDITETSDTEKFIAQPTLISSPIIIGETTMSSDVYLMDLTFSKVIANGGQVSVIIQASLTE